MAAMRALLPLLVAVAAAPAAATTTTPPPLPPFSWDHVPVFQQLCRKNATVAEPLSTRDISFLREYPLVIFEHCHGYNEVATGSSTVWLEDVVVAAAKLLKNPSTGHPHVYLYNNEDAALPWYRWTQEAITDPAHAFPSYFVLDGKTGKPVTGDGGHMLPDATTYEWNQSTPGWTDWYSGFCANVSAGTDSLLDGVFIDTANAIATHQQDVLVKLQHQCAGKVVSAHSPSIMDTVPGAGPWGYQPYTFGSRPAQDLASLRRWTAHGGLYLAHHQNPAGKVNVDGELLPALVTFLIGAGPQSYFAFSENPGLSGFCNGSLPTWCTGMGVSPMFRKPLGQPQPATEVTTDTGNGNTTHYTRHFGRGTTVELTLAGDKVTACRISWSDGSEDVCKV